MTHTGPVPTSDGKLNEPYDSGCKCPKCGDPMKCQTWESSDGAYEDYRYTCTNKDCHYVYWIDGIDS